MIGQLIASATFALIAAALWWGLVQEGRDEEVGECSRPENESGAGPWIATRTDAT